jgi:hypothetical protein
VDDHQEERSYWYMNFQGEHDLMKSGEVLELQNPGTLKSFIALLTPVTGSLIDLPKHRPSCAGRPNGPV